jgi:hypothetical protein
MVLEIPHLLLSKKCTTTFIIRKGINKRSTILQYHGKLGEKDLDQ